MTPVSKLLHPTSHSTKTTVSSPPLSAIKSDNCQTTHITCTTATSENSLFKNTNSLNTADSHFSQSDLIKSFDDPDKSDHQIFDIGFIPIHHQNPTSMEDSSPTVKLPVISNGSLNIFNSPHLEEMAFPVLYPYGTKASNMKDLFSLQCKSISVVAF